MTKRVLLIIGPGQSNEVGSGEEPDCNSGIGAPVRDPCTPNGRAATSMWPYLAELAGNQNVWLGVRNHAFGATAAADSWVGRCRSWISGQIVTRGSYSLNGGNIFKCASAAGNVYTSTAAPAAGTGADGVTWTLARVASAEDVDGAVYTSSSALFDPNGYLAACAASLSSAVGWDIKCCLISIGQSDKTLSVSRSQYSTALINATNYLIGSGADKVAIGFTCYGAAAGLTAWYDSDLVPGWGDAIASFTGNSKVFAGANLYQLLGALPVSPAVKTTPGLKSDQLHMNNSAYALASQAWASNLIANGVF